MSTQFATQERVSYLTQLLNLRSPANSDFSEIRDRAAVWLQELAIPTTRDEDWRFTDLSSLLDIQFQAPPKVEISPETIAEFVLPETAQSHLVFVNGKYASTLSNLEALPEGVFVGNIAQLSAQKRDRLGEYLAQQPGNEEVFTTLNTASLSDVAIVWAAKNKAIETPIQLLFVAATGDAPTLVQPRCLVVAEAHSSLTLIEQYTSTTAGCPDAKGDRVYFTNSVAELWVADNAQIEHVRMQRDAGNAFHIGKTAVTQSRDSRYTCHAIGFGSKLSRHNLDVFQAGEGTQTTLNGLTLISGQQVADTHSTIALNCPNGTANQLHKCIIDGSAHGIFDGRVCVPKAAQLTNASQLNRNLLLSPKARVNTKPQLEIVADNVKCAHGATVSQLEEDEVFYLQSRGLDRQASEHLLVDAFGAEILQQIPVSSIGKILSQCVSCRTYLT
ncbi:Fe-S cluster assembly protein SufD [Oscillatoriales cyanobacterium LEGE 11467]|uniref:Fe-S cluster assembly protein SufD n=1 Tax=Zarconia navalis LEGE 11467 TaxID=1828826 RepID=A0A928W083_9CYAN|nr:Fe-S cluster assembly protein SufD [Zarconia navalis]MBE9040910.1 Fe-S cluster assembly protein SufD [Zarconia navalis LEGE 11467]